MFLLLAMISLGVGVARAGVDSSKERLIAEVEKLGGKVDLDETRPDKPIIKIDLHSTKVSDSDLVFLNKMRKHLKNLRYLDLRLTHIGDEGVDSVKNLT